MPRKSSISVGDVFTTNEGCRCIVLEYESYDKILVEFEDQFKYKKFVSSGSLISGCVKNPYFRSVHGVGYVGVGIYDISLNSGSYKTFTYDRWKSMITRCYSVSCHRNQPTYINCIVCDEWHNYQNFAEWVCKDAGYFELSWQLDKDLLGDGNLYSPKTCTFLPQEINLNIKGRIGVDLHAGGKYRARHKEDHLGLFDTYAEAAQAFKIRKEEYIKGLANKYKDVLSLEVYNAIFNYEVEIGGT